MFNKELTRPPNRIKKKRISLNTLANQIVDFHVNYGTSSSKAGLVPIHRLALVMLLEAYNEEQIKDLAQRIVRITGEDSTLQLRGRYDFEDDIICL